MNRYLMSMLTLMFAVLVFGVTGKDAIAQTRGGELVFAVSAEPPNYDCHRNSSFAFVHSVRPHYSTLLKFDAPNYPAVTGDLAESWTISEDGLTYTFKLHDGVKFHDGSTLTSADVKASYDRIINPQEGIVSLRQGAYSDIVSVEAPDDLTVVMKLKAPNSAMIALLASPWNCIYSAAKLEENPRYPETEILGTGAFVPVEHEAGSHWIGERFDDYFQEGKPYLDSYRAIYMRSTAARVNALQAGEVLAEFRGHTPANRDKLVDALGDKVNVYEQPWACVLNISLNVEKEPFDDPRVRKALSLAVDRWNGAEALSKIAFVRRVGGVLRPGYDLATPDEDLESLPGFGRDVEAAREEARRLLAEAGQSDLKFTFTNRNISVPYEAVGVFLVDQWRQIGVDAVNDPLPTAEYLAKLRGGNAEAGLDFVCDFMDEPNLQLLKYISTDNSSINYGQYTDRYLDELFEKQIRARTKEERVAILRQFEHHVMEQAYNVPTFWWQRIIVNWKQVNGWHMSPSHHLNQDLTDVWLSE